MANLILQMTLYFNVTIFPIWSTIILLFLYKNYSTYEEFYKYITTTLIVTVLLVEVARLFLGYEGNLKDKIPELAGFWILSLLLQFPMQGFLLFNPYFKLFVVEKVVQSIIFIMVCIELVSGYYALRTIARDQAEMFKKDKNVTKNETKTD